MKSPGTETVEKTLLSPAGLKEWTIVGLIIAVHLSLCGMYLYRLYQTGLIDLNFQDGVDSLTYHLRGISVAGGEARWLLSKQSLYHAVVGTLYALFGTEPLAVFVFQIILSASVCMMLYLFGRKFFNPTVGLLSSAIYAIYPVGIFYTALLQRTTLITLVDISLVAAFILCLEKRKFAYYAMAAALSVLAVSGRYNIILFILVFVFWSLFAHFDFYKKLKSLDPAVFASLGILLPLSALAVWSQIYDINNMVQWVAGNSYDSTGFYRVPQEGVIPTFSWGFLRSQFNKAFLFFNSFEAPNNFNFYLFKEKISLLQYLPLSFGMILSFAAVGIVAAIKNRKKIAPFVLFIASYAISVILFFISSRHRHPVTPILIMLAAYGLYDMVQNIKWKKRKFLTIQIALIAFISIFSFFQTTGIREAKNEFEAIQRLKFGNLYVSLGRYNEAAEEFTRATNSYPTYWPAFMNLGSLYEREGDFKKAIEAYSRVISLNPLHAEAYFGKGNAFVSLKRYHEAVKYYRKAIDQDPQNPVFYNNLGRALLGTEAYSEAASAFEKYLSFVPDHVEMHLQLARIYANKIKDNDSALLHLTPLLNLPPGRTERSEAEALLGEINDIK